MCMNRPIFWLSFCHVESAANVAGDQLFVLSLYNTVANAVSFAHSGVSFKGILIKNKINTLIRESNKKRIKPTRIIRYN